MNTILVRKASVWFLHIPQIGESPSFWLNLALVTHIRALKDSRYEAPTIKVCLLDNSSLVFQGERASVILHELDLLSSRPDFDSVKASELDLVEG